jgi:hypothetical protein
MKRIINFIVAITMLAALACSGGAGDSNTLVALVKGKSYELKPTATAILHDSVTDAARHTLIFTNYELPKVVTKMRLQGSAKKEGSTRIQIEVIGAKGTDKNSPLQAGEYKAVVGNVGSAINSANGALVAFSENGKESRTYFGGPEMKEGKVVIDSVKDGKVTGSVKLQDGENTLSGNFVASM